MAQTYSTEILTRSAHYGSKKDHIRLTDSESLADGHGLFEKTLSLALAVGVVNGGIVYGPDIVKKLEKSPKELQNFIQGLSDGFYDTAGIDSTPIVSEAYDNLFKNPSNGAYKIGAKGGVNAKVARLDAEANYGFLGAKGAAYSNDKGPANLDKARSSGLIVKAVDGGKPLVATTEDAKKPAKKRMVSTLADGVLPVTLSGLSSANPEVSLMPEFYVALSDKDNEDKIRIKVPEGLNSPIQLYHIGNLYELVIEPRGLEYMEIYAEGNYSTRSQIEKTFLSPKHSAVKWKAYKSNGDVLVSEHGSPEENVSKSIVLNLKDKSERGLKSEPDIISDYKLEELYVPKELSANGKVVRVSFGMDSSPHGASLGDAYLSGGSDTGTPRSELTGKSQLTESELKAFSRYAHLIATIDPSKGLPEHMIANNTTGPDGKIILDSNGSPATNYKIPNEYLNP